MRIGVLTISDKGARGERADTSGPAIVEMVAAIGGEAVQRGIVPDESEAIQATLKHWADDMHLDLILTTGGTGLASRDVTPEATLGVIEREAPGIVEAVRAESLKKTPFAMLSRAVAGIRGSTLIVNLPGSEKAVRESLAVILPVLPHAVDLLHGKTEH